MLSEAVQTAVRMETDAIQYYQEAAGRTAHAFGKRMFEGFIKDETRHLKMLRDILDGMDLPDGLAAPGQEINTVFSEAKQQMDERVTAATTDMQAVKIALDFEKEGYDFYQKAAVEATDEREKALLSRLAQEEQVHYSLLEETHAYLASSGDWFLWEEGGLLEG